MLDLSHHIPLEGVFSDKMVIQIPSTHILAYDILVPSKLGSWGSEITAIIWGSSKSPFGQAVAPTLLPCPRCANACTWNAMLCRSNQVDHRWVAYFFVGDLLIKTSGISAPRLYHHLSIGFQFFLPRFWRRLELQTWFKVTFNIQEPQYLDGSHSSHHVFCAKYRDTAKTTSPYDG